MSLSIAHNGFGLNDSGGFRSDTLSNLNKCIIEAQQFISALHRQFWLGAVISRFSSQINNKMAGIDKTYTDSYSDYKEFKTWADKQTLTFFNGHKVCIGNWVWDYEKEDFDGGERPIMNTPTWLDIYLIQNCKSDFVLNRMKSVYSAESYEEFKTVDLTSPPSGDFKQNRKITIKRSDRTKFPLHKKPYGGKTKWWLQCDDNFGYCDETKVWSSYDNYYPHNTNTAHIKSIKGLVRHLRKQYLPKGITFTIIGRYVGEEYLVSVS